jgi:hypothetical protein
MLYTSGEKAPHSGIYTVTHDPGHPREHEVTCIKGRKFPPCRNCKGVRFELKKATIHVEDHLYFKTDEEMFKAGREALSGKGRSKEPGSKLASAKIKKEVR